MPKKKSRFASFKASASKAIKDYQKGAPERERRRLQALKAQNKIEKERAQLAKLQAKQRQYAAQGRKQTDSALGGGFSSDPFGSSGFSGGYERASPQGYDFVKGSSYDSSKPRNPPKTRRKPRKRGGGRNITIRID